MPAKKRITENSENGIYRISIEPRQSIFAVIFAVVGILIAVVGMASNLIEISKGPVLSNSVILFLVTCFVFMLFWIGLVGLNGLWTIWGMWDAAISADTLKVDIRLLAFRWSKLYLRERISETRVHESRGKGGIVNRRIAFKYEGADVYITPALSEEEADSLIQGAFRNLSRHGQST